jgi:hypothetical protein
LEAESEALVCPGCGEAIDPNLNICEHCGFVHLGRLEANSASTDKSRSDETGPVRKEAEIPSPEYQSRGTSRNSYICPHPDCRERNYVFDESANRCFNCGRELWLSREAREARWYEEHGRRLGRDLEVVGILALGLCIIALLGIPLLVGVIVQGRRGNAQRKKGEAMNREAGRKPQARAARHFGETGGEYWVYQGPDGEDRPDHPEFGEPEWLKPFARIYYISWLVIVALTIIFF